MKRRRRTASSLPFPFLLLLLSSSPQQQAAAQPPAAYIPLTKASAHNRLSPELLAQSGRVDVSTTSLRGAGGGDKATSAAIPAEEKDKAAGEAAIHHPMTTLDARLTAYFASITFGGGQELQLLVDTGR